MNANPILLQKKYAKVVVSFAGKMGISLDDSLKSFYESKTYELMRDGVADMHCMDEAYLAEELIDELKTK